MSDISPISNYLCDAIDTAAANIEVISSAAADACEQITHTLLNDRKLLVCGNGYAAPFASLLTTCLMHQLGYERPSLPAINLSIDSTTISAIAKDGNYHNVYAKQIRALGNEGDTLIALSIDGNCGNIVQAIQCAHEKGIQVITIVGYEGGKISAVKQEKDVEIQLHCDRVDRAMESQLLAINTLCHQVECQLFGAPY